MKPTDEVILADLRKTVWAEMDDQTFDLVVKAVEEAGDIRNTTGYAMTLIQKAVVEKRSFGSRSEAGRYAANVRWEGHQTAQAKDGDDPEGNLRDVKNGWSHLLRATVDTGTERSEKRIDGYRAIADAKRLSDATDILRSEKDPLLRAGMLEAYRTRFADNPDALAPFKDEKDGQQQASDLFLFEGNRRAMNEKLAVIVRETANDGTPETLGRVKGLTQIANAKNVREAIDLLLDVTDGDVDAGLEEGFVIRFGDNPDVMRESGLKKARFRG